MTWIHKSLAQISVVALVLLSPLVIEENLAGAQSLEPSPPVVQEGGGTAPFSPSGIPAPVETPVSEGSVPVTVSPDQKSSPSPDPAPGAIATAQIAAPANGAVLNVPATSVVVRYPIGQTITLTLNGSPVDPTLIGRTETDDTAKVITQTWYGVGLTQANNELVVLDRVSGIRLTQVTISVAGLPERLELKTREASIPADGKSKATVLGRFLDNQGNQSNYSTLVTLVPSAGEFVGIDASLLQPGFQVKAEQGQFTATLKSALQGQTVRIQAVAGDLEGFTQFQFATNLRPSVATGVLDFRLGQRGTNFYRSFQDFIPADENFDTGLDFQSAGFATGSVGEWLFTGAFNSARPLNANRDSQSQLFRDTQFFEQVYPVYGDESKSEILTPSKDSLYLRFERSSTVANAPPDFFMWGDFDLKEFSAASQQFTSISRNLHGFKGNYTLDALQLTALYSNDTDGFQRDVIAPNGTRGFYFLSQRPLISGSEIVYIEQEKQFEPGTVVNRARLQRSLDYEIDVDRGTLFFREPVARLVTDPIDGTTLIQRIVVTYQFEGENGGTSLYAGRIRYFFSRQTDHESWLGVTYFQENQGSRRFELYGADAYVSLGDKSQVIAEYAHSSQAADLQGTVSGSAYRITAEGWLSDQLWGRTYWSQTDPGFTNNATVSFVAGQTRYGAELKAQLSPETSVNASFERLETYGAIPRLFDPLEDTPTENPLVNSNLTTFSLGVDQRFGDASAELDWITRSREDTIESTVTHSSQLRSQVKVPLNDRLTVAALNETTLSATSDTVYPDRTAVGLSWELSDSLFLDASQNWYKTSQSDTQSFTSVGLRGDYSMGSDARVFARYALLNGLDNASNVGSIGVQYRWTILSGLAMDLSYERVFSDYVSSGSDATPQIYTAGSEGWALGVKSGEDYSLGIAYTENPDFKASLRYDQSNTASGSNAVFTGDLLGKVSPTLTALLNYQQASSANVSINGRLDPTINLRLGLAYRDPQNDQLNALLRYEYRKNPSSLPDSLLLTGGSQYESHLIALEAIYAPDWQWELYGKFAFRSGLTQLGQDFSSYSSTALTQLRATYRLDYHWELMTEARWIQQPAAGYRETGLVAEAGYFLTPDLKLAVGFNSGSVDQDFGDSRGGQGLYAGVTVKLNQLFDGFGLQPTPALAEMKDELPPVSALPQELTKPQELTQGDLDLAAIYLGALGGQILPPNPRDYTDPTPTNQSSAKTSTSDSLGNWVMQN